MEPFGSLKNKISKKPDIDEFIWESDERKKNRTSIFSITKFDFFTYSIFLILYISLIFTPPR
jgi:hypothetical protein